jgi:hypothetical protein
MRHGFTSISLNMIKNNVYVKYGFNDWLYCLIYEIQFIGLPLYDEPFMLSNMFDECRKARFRFENRSLFTEDALADDTFLYGPYHLARLNLNDDFEKISLKQIPEDLGAFIHCNVSPLVSQDDQEKAVSVISAVLDKLLMEETKAFKSNLIDEQKMAPFAIVDFFQSYLVFHNGKKEVTYIELGAD